MTFTVEASHPPKPAQPAPAQRITVFSKGEEVGSMFSILGKELPSVLRWLDMIGAKDVKITLIDGEYLRRLVYG